MRPHYHFAPQANWLSDPNGLVHDGATWHLFYQYNPHGEDWGNMAWGHATSPDLAVWQEHPPALLADDTHMVFSGSAVIDESGDAGFGREAMVAIYTAAARSGPERQAQALAFSIDRGQNWTQFADNPVLDLAMADFRDPFVFRHDPSGAWVMVVVKSNEQVAQLYRSTDLRAWTLASEIHAGTAPGRVWECPTLVELPVRGVAATRWLFKVDALHDAPGAGALYLTGSFDGFNFVADGAWQPVDMGRDFYAAIAWNGPRDAAGRPAWIGWMGNHAYQHHFPRKGWRGVMSLPRRLELVETASGLRLAQEIEKSVAALFGEPRPMPSDGRIPLAGKVHLGGEFSGRLTLVDGLGASFTVEATGEDWHLERRDSTLPFLDCKSSLARNGGGLSLWIDSETIEALSDDGTGAASFQHRPANGSMLIDSNQPEHVSWASLA